MEINMTDIKLQKSVIRLNDMKELSIDSLIYVLQSDWN